MSILIEVVQPFTVREHGQVSSWQIGQRKVLTPENAQRVIERVGSKVRVVDPDAMDHMIGTAVQASMEYVIFENEGQSNAATRRITGAGPWIVADVVVVDGEPGLLTGRWLLLVHGPSLRWSHESTVTPYRCPTCKGAHVWWSEHTVLCAQCIPPSVPQWQILWREVAALSAGLTVDAPLLAALQSCDDAFKAGDYAGFQAGVVRVRRASLMPAKLSGRK